MLGLHRVDSNARGNHARKSAEEARYSRLCLCRVLAYEYAAKSRHSYFSSLFERNRGHDVIACRLDGIYTAVGLGEPVFSAVLSPIISFPRRLYG